MFDHNLRSTNLYGLRPNNLFFIKHQVIIEGTVNSPYLVFLNQYSQVFQKKSEGPTSLFLELQNWLKNMIRIFFRVESHFEIENLFLRRLFAKEFLRKN